MKKKAKTIFTAFLVIMFIILIISVATQYKNYKIVKHEEDKYALYLKIKNYRTSYRGITVYPRNDQSKIFYAEQNGKNYRDGYAYRLVEPQLKERIEGIKNNDFKNLKFSVMISHDEDGLLSVTNYNYKGIPDLEDFLNKESKSSIEIKAFINYGEKLDEEKLSEEIKDFAYIIMDNRFSNKNINISFIFYLVSEKNYKKIKPERYKFDMVKKKEAEKSVYIKFQNWEDYKNGIKVQFTDY